MLGRYILGESRATSYQLKLDGDFTRESSQILFESGKRLTPVAERTSVSNAGSDGTQPEAKVDKAEELMERLKEDAGGAKPW